MATSIETAAGTWAVVPMGDLQQRLNTFWQLFFRPLGGSNWSDQASGLAVATNGGLVVTTPGGKALAVGIRPANLLDYSPLLVTSDAGRTWSPAPPVAALAQQPDSLAFDGAKALALATVKGGDEVLDSQGSVAGWHTLTTSEELGRSPAGRSCGLVSMTAVVYAAGRPLVGASCRRPGVTGIFADSGGVWRVAGPKLLQSTNRARVDVLGLRQDAAGLWALLALSEGRRTSLLVAWTNGETKQWTLSPTLDIGSMALHSFGPDGGSGLFVLMTGPDSVERVALVSAPGAEWTHEPAPPAGTETMVFGPAGRVDALCVNDTRFTDWTLLRSDRWAKRQAVNVPIEFGSSS